MQFLCKVWYCIVVQGAADEIRKYGYTSTQRGTPAADQLVTAERLDKAKVKEGAAELKQQCASHFANYLDEKLRSSNRGTSRPPALVTDSKKKVDDNSKVSPIWLVITYGNDKVNLEFEKIFDNVLESKIDYTATGGTGSARKTTIMVSTDIFRMIGAILSVTSFLRD